MEMKVINMLYAVILQKTHNAYMMTVNECFLSIQKEDGAQM
jgi:hypothetical protein